MEEKYYWKNQKNELIPKHELNDYYVCNIVAKYGKKWLSENGHTVLVQRYEELNRQYHFFKEVKGSVWMCGAVGSAPV